MTNCNAILQRIDHLKNVLRISRKPNEGLHKVLQKAFEWKNYHLHSFTIFNGNQPVVNLVMSAEDLEYADKNIETKLSADIKLSDYAGYKRIKYTYDYGDNWEHYIEITATIENCTEPSPALVAGEGDSPPEGVGGDGGFDEFLRIMSDPADEEYEHMKSWAKMQEYNAFDIESVSRVVANALKW